MLRYASLFAIAVVTSTPAFAQRTDENAVEEAEDAFGTSVGDEKIGLYSAGDVRGFSPSTAGNIRFEGLSITQHGGITSRFVNGSTIKVGLTAQGYPFLAPTGIADYILRSVGTATVVSSVATVGPYDTLGLSVDVKLPIGGDRAGLAAGASYKYEENFPGVDGHIIQAGGVFDLRPSETSRLKAFYSRLQIVDDRDVGSIFTGGAYLPPEIERRDFGLPWTEGQVSADLFGSLGTIDLSENLTVKVGLFRSGATIHRDASELYRNTQPDGSSALTVVSNDQNTAKSTSGELRTSFAKTEGDRKHTIHVAGRGRDPRRLFGGANVRNLGASTIGVRQFAPEPEYVFGPKTSDSVRQLTGGLGYELRWLGIGELRLGLQKTDYRKRTVFPDPLRPLVTTTASPWH